MRNGTQRGWWFQYKVWYLESETVLSKSEDYICFISSSVRQYVIISLSTSVGEDRISVESSRIATILFSVRFTVVDELTGRIFYLMFPLKIAYFLSMMAMVGLFVNLNFDDVAGHE